MRIAMMSAGAGTQQSEYIRCSFNGTQMEMHPGGFARFVECSVRDVVITHWSVAAGDMINCVFSGTIKTAIFNGTVDLRLQKDFGKILNDFEGRFFPVGPATAMWSAEPPRSKTPTRLLNGGRITSRGVRRQLFSAGSRR